MITSINEYKIFLENTKSSTIKLQRCQFGNVSDEWNFNFGNGQHGEGIYCYQYPDNKMKEYYSKNGESVYNFEIDRKYIKDCSNKNYDYWEAKKLIYDNPQYKAFIFKHSGIGIPNSKEVLITHPEIIMNIEKVNNIIKESKFSNNLVNDLIKLVKTSKNYQEFEKLVIYYGILHKEYVNVDELINTEKVDLSIKSISKFPISVVKDIRNGKMYIMDGHHRVAEAKQRNEKTIYAYLTYGKFTKPNNFQPDTSLYFNDDKEKIKDFYLKYKKN